MAFMIPEKAEGLCLWYRRYQLVQVQFKPNFAVSDATGMRNEEGEIENKKENYYFFLSFAIIYYPFISATTFTNQHNHFLSSHREHI